MEIDKFYKIVGSDSFMVIKVRNVNGNNFDYAVVQVNGKRCRQPFLRRFAVDKIGSSPQEVPDPYPYALDLEKAKKLKIGDTIKYSGDRIADTNKEVLEGKILDIWGNKNDKGEIEDDSYSFQVSHEDSWYHIYVSDVIFEE